MPRVHRDSAHIGRAGVVVDGGAVANASTISRSAASLDARTASQAAGAVVEMTPHMLELVRHFCGDKGGPVLEIGSYIEAQQDHMNVRGMFPSGTPYLGVDANPGPGVDRVADLLDIDAMRQVCREVRPRIVLCLYVLEHVWDIHKAAQSLATVWQEQPCWLLAATHQRQPFHGTPKYADYWRLTLHGLERLMTEAGVPAVKVFGHGSTSDPDDIIAVRQPFNEGWPGWSLNQWKAF